MTMYRLMLYLLISLVVAAAGLSALDLLPYVWWHILLSAVYLMAACFTFNWLLAKIFKATVNFESQLITALILSLITGPQNPLDNIVFLTVLALASQASKYLLAYKKRHIFNPAAIAVTFTAIVMAQGASWWIGNQYLNLLVVAGGLLIRPRSRWFALAMSFLAAYLLLILTQTRDLTFMVYSPIFFFVFIMLVEPLTGPAGKKNKILYGIFIALALFLLQTFSTLPYTLELSLLLGNLVFWAMGSKEKIMLNFSSKQPIAQNIYAYWFTPTKKFNYQPGQFLEWTLPHAHADSRGIRRWFTIASSPTEDRILLATKQAVEKPSSFKTSLNAIKKDQEMVATDPDGDFTLPKDEKKKLVFIAGGIGITPFRSMTKYLLDTNQKRDIVLLYSARTEIEFAFKDIWSEAQKKLGFKPIFVPSDKKGYITAELIKQEIPDWQERMFYVSGPEPMVEAFEKMLGDMGIKHANLKRDFFPGYKETYS